MDGGRPVATPLDSLLACLRAANGSIIVKRRPSESNSATPPVVRPINAVSVAAVVDAFRNVEKSASLLTHKATPLDDDDISSAQKGLGVCELNPFG